MQTSQIGRLMVLVKVDKEVLELFVSLLQVILVVMGKVWSIASDEDLHQEYMMVLLSYQIIERVEIHNCLGIHIFQIQQLRYNTQLQIQELQHLRK